MSRTVVGNLLRDYSRILSETSMDIECIHHYIVYSRYRIGCLKYFHSKGKFNSKTPKFHISPMDKKYIVYNGTPL